MRRRITAAHQVLDAIGRAWGNWADSVRQGAETRQGVPAGADLQEDPGYWLALDAGAAISRAKEAILDVEARFTEAEAAAEQAEAAGPEAQL
jgi:hypothetical protein